MAEVNARVRAVYQAAFFGIAAVLIFFRLLPVNPGPGSLPGPDLIVLVAFAWVLRRPDFVPVWLVASVMLLADLLFMRPPGLWAAATVLGLEYLRSRAGAWREMGFLAEWGRVALTLFVMVLGTRALLLVLLVDQPAFGLQLIELLMTIGFYPVVVAASRLLFGIRKPSPREFDAAGRPT